MGNKHRLVLAAFALIYLLAGIGVDRLRETVRLPAKGLITAATCAALLYPLVGDPRLYLKRLAIAPLEYRMLKDAHVSLGLWLKEEAGG